MTVQSFVELFLPIAWLLWVLAFYWWAIGRKSEKRIEEMAKPNLQILVPKLSESSMMYDSVCVKFPKSVELWGKHQFHMPRKVSSTLWVWIHEATEAIIDELLPINEWNISCSVANNPKTYSLAHILTCLSVSAMGRGLKEITPEKFSENFSFNRNKTK